MLASKPQSLGQDDAHILCPPFSEPVSQSAQVIVFIGGRESLANLKGDILNSVAACVENGGILLLLDNGSASFGVPLVRQHHVDSSCGRIPSVESLLSKIPLRAETDGRDRMTPRQAVAATLAPGVRTIIYSKKMHPEEFCLTSSQRIVGSFSGQVTKANDNVCLLCEFHDNGRQPLAASNRFGKGSILHVVLNLGK